MLGMHRSGTSALAGALHYAGCSVPEKLATGDKNNETGYWESSVVFNLNDALLTSVGSEWSDSQPIDEAWYRSSGAEGFRERAVEKITQLYGSSKLLVLKDPRICRLVPFWLDVLTELDIIPKVVIAFRNPLEVAESLKARDNFESGVSCLLWLRHLLDAEKFTRGMPRAICSYEDLLTRRDGLIADIGKDLGVRWPKSPKRRASDIDELLSVKYRHHNQLPESVLDNTDLPKWVRDTFDIFLRWAESGESAADFRAIDMIKSELDAAGQAFSDVVKISREQTTSHFSPAKTSAQSDAAAVTVGLEPGTDIEMVLQEMAHKLAQTESALVQRRHESEQTAAALDIMRAELAEKTEAESANAEKILNLTTDLDQSRQTAHESNMKRQKVEKALTAQFEETATLLGMLKKTQDAARDRLDQERHRFELDRRKHVHKSQWLEYEKRQREIETQQKVADMMRSLIAAQAHSALPGRLGLRRPVRMLKRSGLFDSQWYLSHYPDVSEAGLDPAFHFVRFGAAEGRAMNESLLSENFFESLEDPEQPEGSEAKSE